MAENRQYETLEETAKKWRVSIERLIAACERGDVPDAALLNSEWIIPKDIQRPHIKNLPKAPKPPTEFVDVDGTLTAKTPIQEAVIHAIDKGDNLGWVSEHHIGNTTYIVSSVFKRQGITLGETIFNRVVRGLQEDGALPQHFNAEQRKGIDEARDEVRRNSSVFTMTKEEKMEAYRRMLEQYGFSPPEVTRLMRKIEADYEEPDFDIRSSYSSTKKPKEPTKE